MPRVFISDEIESGGLQLLKQSGLEVDHRPGLKGDALKEAMRQADGMIVRSHTKVTAELLDNPGKLRAVVRAGVGVDNIDIAAATRKGIVVMNTPGGNTVSTAEQTIALLMALARHIPAADASVKLGKWERGKFVGTQLAGKTLGVIGLGRVGREVGPPGRRARHEDRRLRSVPRARSGRAAGHRKHARPGHAAETLRYSHRAHAADAGDDEPDRQPGTGAAEEGSPRHQLRPRRHHQRTGPGGVAAIGPSRRGRPGRLRAGTAAGRDIRCSSCPAW